MKGIANILIVLAWCLDTFMDIKKSKEDDGKINLKDAPRFIDNITSMPAVVKSAPEVLEEALDLDGDEGEQIAQLIIEKTGVPREAVKLVIRKCIKTTVGFSNTIKDGIELADAIKALKETA